MGKHLLEGFRKRLADNAMVKDIRALGLMIGIELNEDCADLVAKALHNQLLINVTAGNVIRLLPPLIIDEAQNLTPHEVKTIITRAGEGTKLIFTGDIQQIDSPYLDTRSNGLSYLADRMKGQDIFAHVHLVKGERSYLADLASNLL